MKTIETSVCIVGAGPAGVSAAMNLNKRGIDCVLVDKYSFPRDKVCGECFDGHAYHVLKRLDANYLGEMEEQGIVLKSWDYWFADENQQKINTSFDHKATPRLLAKRTDFDTFLIEKARAMPHVTLLENTEIRTVTQEADGVRLRTKDGKTEIKAKMTVGATGAMSSFFNSLTEIPKRQGETYTFVRQYYQNVRQLPNNEVAIHVFYEPAIVLYICPLPDGVVSVEVGIKQSEAKKHGVNLREKIVDLVRNYAPIAPQFRYATPIDSLKGAAIQLSYKNEKLSGERFLLIGSAGQSVHPVSGFGVGHAMAAGEIAAKVMAEAFEKQDFSAAFLKQYDRALRKKLGNEILLSRIMTYIFDHPRICLPIFFKLGSYITDAFTHKDFSEQFLNPAFYYRLLGRRLAFTYKH